MPWWASAIRCSAAWCSRTPATVMHSASLAWVLLTRVSQAAGPATAPGAATHTEAAVTASAARAPSVVRDIRVSRCPRRFRVGWPDAAVRDRTEDLTSVRRCPARVKGGLATLGPSRPRFVSPSRVVRTDSSRSARLRSVLPGSGPSPRMAARCHRRPRRSSPPPRTDQSPARMSAEPGRATWRPTGAARRGSEPVPPDLSAGAGPPRRRRAPSSTGRSRPRRRRRRP